jgi:hypothetical protein
MIATGYTLAGVLIIVVFGLISCCTFAKSAGGYDEELEEGLEIETKKYAKVNPSTDA